MSDRGVACIKSVVAKVSSSVSAAPSVVSAGI